MSPYRRGFVTSVLFPCPTPSYNINSFPGELIWVPKGPLIGDDASTAPDRCESVPCLLLPYESARFLIVFFHSNAEDLGRCRWFCQFLREQFQCHVMAVEYPGYGVCMGTATPEGIIGNAHAALHFVTQVLRLPLEQIKIFGRSIGNAPALHLAAKFKVAGLVLVTPFVSVRTLFKDRVGPLSNFVDEWFQNDEHMRNVQSPTMIIHGRGDRIIPWKHSEELYKLCTTRKLFISPKGMEHNANLTTNIAFLTMPMFRFFSLPDYSFDELKVPAWAFDKRRSPYYVRPAIEVQSRAIVLPVKSGSSPGINLPEPDEDEDPVDPTLDIRRLQRELTEELKGRARSAIGDQPVVDYESITVLSNPVVLHSYMATKQRYDFHGGGLADRRGSILDTSILVEQSEILYL